MFRLVLLFGVLCANPSWAQSDSPNFEHPSIRNSKYQVVPESVEVSGLLGTISYSMPVAVPPGRNGQQPSISIAHSSMTKDGPLGWGWKLNAVSRISVTSRFGFPCMDSEVCRNLREQHLPQWGNLDLYEMDGRLLVPDPSDQNRYYFQNHQGQRIRYISGSNTWLIESPDGSRVEYEMERVRNLPFGASPSQQDIYTWAIKRSFDRHGNYILFSYNSDHLIESIQYNFHEESGLSLATDGQRRVDFFWELPNYVMTNGNLINPFKQSSTRMAFVNLQQHRLSHIVTGLDQNNSGVLEAPEVHTRYDFNYRMGKTGSSFLESISRSGNNLVPYPEETNLEFTYSEEFQGWDDEPLVIQNPTGAGPIRGQNIWSTYADALSVQAQPGYGSVDLLDVTGDSIADRVVLRDGDIFVYRGEVSSAGVYSISTTAENWTPDSPELPYPNLRHWEIVYRDRELNFWIPIREVEESRQKTDLIDMNGDRLVDYVVSSGGGDWSVYFNNGSRFLPPVTWGFQGAPYSSNDEFELDVSFSDNNDTRHLMDVNVDGLPDLRFPGHGTYINTGQGFIFTSYDFDPPLYSKFYRDVNGDGVPDSVNFGSHGIQFFSGPGGETFSWRTRFNKEYVFERSESVLQHRLPYNIGNGVRFTNYNYPNSADFFEVGCTGSLWRNEALIRTDGDHANCIRDFEVKKIVHKELIDIDGDGFVDDLETGRVSESRHDRYYQNGQNSLDVRHGFFATYNADGTTYTYFDFGGYNNFMSELEIPSLSPPDSETGIGFTGIRELSIPGYIHWDVYDSSPDTFLKKYCISPGNCIVPEAADVYGLNVTTELIDVNGDGYLDRLVMADSKAASADWQGRDTSWRVFLHKGGPRLIEVKNQAGGITEIEYISSARVSKELLSTSLRNPLALPTDLTNELDSLLTLGASHMVVDRLIVKDGRSGANGREDNPLRDISTKYQYANLVYDPNLRELVGFRMNKKYNSGNRHETNFYYHAPERRGQVAFTELGRGPNIILSSSVNQIASTFSEDLAGNPISSGPIFTVYSPLSIRSTKLTTETRGGGYIYSRDINSFDPIRVRPISNSSAGIDGEWDTADDLTTYLRYPSDFGIQENESDWLINYPVSSELHVGGSLYSTSRTYYDDQEFGQAPTQGNVTRSESDLDTSAGAVSVTTAGYDGYGNLSWLYKPESFSDTGALLHSVPDTRVDYDNEYKSFVVRSRSRLDHQTRTSIDPLYGHVDKTLSSTGQLSCANYDDLGRITAYYDRDSEVMGIATSLGDSCSPIPKTRYRYENLGRPTLQYTLTENLSESGSVVSWERAYTDGLGRNFLNVQLEDDGVYHQYSQWDRLGQLVCVTKLTTGDSNGQRNDNCMLNPANTVYTYDWWGRKKRTLVKGSGGTSSLSLVSYSLESLSGYSQPVMVTTHTVRSSTANVPTFKKKVYSSPAGVVRVSNGNSIVNLVRNPLGQIIQVSGVNPEGANNTMTFQYDQGGRRIEQQNLGTGAVWRYSYWPDGSLKRKISPRGPRYDVVYHYDPVGRMDFVDYYPHSTAGDVKGAEDTVYTYSEESGSSLGKLIELKKPGYLARFEYNLRGETSETQRAVNGRSFNFGYTYDRDGQVLTKTYPDGDVWTYSYGVTNQLLGITSQYFGSLVSGIQWDHHKKLKAYNLRNSSISTVREYHPDSRRLEGMTSATTSGEVALDNELSTDWTGQIYRVNDARNGVHNSEYFYDNHHRLTNANQVSTSAGISNLANFQFDNSANLIQEQINSQPVVNYSMVGTNVLTRDAHSVSSNGLSQFGYDWSGNRVNRVRLSGTGSSYDFYDWDSDNRLKYFSSTVNQAWYTYDSSGRRVEKQVRRRSSSSLVESRVYPTNDYEVDLLSGIHTKHLYLMGERIGLLSSRVESQSTLDGDGDGIADLLDNCPDAANSDQADKNNDAQGDICDFDINNDHIIDAQDLWLLSAANFSSAGDPNYDVNLDYNNDGEIGLADVTAFGSMYMSGDRFEAMVRPGSVGNQFLSQVDVPTVNEYYLHNDHLSSPLAISDASGRIIQRNILNPYGETLRVIRYDESGAALPGSRESVTSYLFTGHEYDAESGNYYAQARYYDPSIKQFISMDPDLYGPNEGVTFSRLVSDTEAMNGYSYAQNNPTNLSDPTGRFACGGWCIGAVILATFLPMKHDKAGGTDPIAYDLAGGALGFGIGKGLGLLGKGLYQGTGYLYGRYVAVSNRATVTNFSSYSTMIPLDVVARGRRASFDVRLHDFQNGELGGFWHRPRPDILFAPKAFDMNGVVGHEAQHAMNWFNGTWSNKFMIGRQYPTAMRLWGRYADEISAYSVGRSLGDPLQQGGLHRQALHSMGEYMGPRFSSFGTGSLLPTLGTGIGAGSDLGGPVRNFNQDFESSLYNNSGANLDAGKFFGGFNGGYSSGSGWSGFGGSFGFGF